MFKGVGGAKGNERRYWPCILYNVVSMPDILLINCHLTFVIVPCMLHSIYVLLQACQFSRIFCESHGIDSILTLSRVCAINSQKFPMIDKDRDKDC